MCGILAVLGLTGDREVNRRKLWQLSKLLRHRGPDDSGCYESVDGSVFMLQERLTIIDVSPKGRQPFTAHTESGKISWLVNSEIYNHEQIRAEDLSEFQIDSKSDSAVVGYLYAKYGEDSSWINKLDGIFASVVYNETSGDYMAFRDPMGICPMYWGTAKDGSKWFASEMKAIQNECDDVALFPPGHVYRSSTGKLERWYNPKWLDEEYMPTAPLDLAAVRQSFIDSVVKRLMCDVPLGVLLSGGLDSSLVASVAVRHLQQSTNSAMRGQKLHTFSVGLEGSPDLLAARKVAKHLGTLHHEFTFTVEEGIDALRDLIWHIESFEQVRAAVPMYLLARKIKALGIKVVLSGEGADEIFGGYLYFHYAPTPQEFHKETVRKVSRLHQWDVLRANKAPFAWGLETRVPFLDKQFLDTCMMIDPSEKQPNLKDKPDGVNPRLEKWILRKAFDVEDKPYLPQEVLWRQKEQFSDGVGYSWVDGLKDHAESVVTDEMWAAREDRFPTDPPKTKEYYLLRSIFEEQFPSKAALDTVPKGLSVACSTPEAVEWVEEWKNMHEISGRAVSVHETADLGAEQDKRSATVAAASRRVASRRVQLQTRVVPRRAAANVSRQLSTARFF